MKADSSLMALFLELDSVGLKVLKAREYKTSMGESLTNEIYLYRAAQGISNDTNYAFV